MEFWVDLVKTAWDCGIFDRILLKGGLLAIFLGNYFFSVFFILIYVSLLLCFSASLLFAFLLFPASLLL